MNDDQKHCYLFALEIVPLEVGRAYRTLPMHCTLMHRFWSDVKPADLVAQTKPLFSRYTQGITFVPGHVVELGPNKTVVFELENIGELRKLHLELFELLKRLGVNYTEDDWVGPGYTPHASVREDSPLAEGAAFTCKQVNLIEVKVPGHDQERFVREKIALG